MLLLLSVFLLFFNDQRVLPRLALGRQKSSTKEVEPTVKELKDLEYENY
jgi:hypothetical protein